jgi:hypothetical protein
VTALAKASAALIAITQRNPDTKDSSIARRMGVVSRSSRTLKMSFSTQGSGNVILNPNTSRLASHPRRDASMSIQIVTANLTWLRRYVSRWLHATPFTVAAILLTALPALAEPVPGSLPVQWNIGAEDCVASPQPPLQVHTYEPQTFILRQSPCASFEANFIYLLIGSDKALLIDTGAVADPNAMPLAKTVLELLPDKEHKKLPLLVAHTHRHLDHRAGDPQFASLPSTQVVPFNLEGVRAFFGLPTGRMGLPISI